MGRYLKASKVLRPRSALRTGRIPRSLLMRWERLADEEPGWPAALNAAFPPAFWPEEESQGAEEDEGARFDTLVEAWLYYDQELHLAQERLGDIWSRRIPTEILDEWWEQEALHEDLGDDFEIVMLIEEGPYSRGIFDAQGWR